MAMIFTAQCDEREVFIQEWETVRGQTWNTQNIWGGWALGGKVAKVNVSLLSRGLWNIHLLCFSSDLWHKRLFVLHYVCLIYTVSEMSMEHLYTSIQPWRLHESVCACVFSSYMTFRFTVCRWSTTESISCINLSFEKMLWANFLFIQIARCNTQQVIGQTP